MKYIKSITALLVLALSITACGTSQGVVGNDRDKDPYEGKRVYVMQQTPLSLADFLVRAPGVSVRGNSVSIRGAGPPLFIIDNIPIGNSYLSAQQAINPLDIESVEVVSGPETAFYGRRGANGVIIIHTKGSL